MYCIFIFQIEINPLCHLYKPGVDYVAVLKIKEKCHARQLTGYEN